MVTVGISMVRDEADIVGRTVAHMLAECDAVIVADNLSVDDTGPILSELERVYGDRLRIMSDPDPAYTQSAKMTELARLARILGAEWVVPFDADEWWYSPFGRIADVLAGIAPQWLVAPAALYDHVATAFDPDDIDPISRMGWRRKSANPLPKVACRWRPDLTIAQGNHDAYYGGGATRYDELLVVRHFPYRSAEQLIRKVRNGAAAYRAAGDSVSADFGAHWRQWGDLLDAQGPDAIAEIFRTWYWREDPRAALPTGDGLQPPLIYDPAPGA